MTQTRTKQKQAQDIQHLHAKMNEEVEWTPATKRAAMKSRNLISKEDVREPLEDLDTW